MSHVAITGASSGIGEALAREFLANGASVTLVARRKNLLEKIAQEAGGKTHVVAADLSDVEHAADWLAPAQEALGPIDVLINNAGIMMVGATASMDLAKCEELMRLDLLSPMRIMHTILPQMMARKSGVIVNISSAAALAPTPGIIWYSAAKAGIAAASESLRGELAALRCGVRVVTVYPGPVDTALAHGALSNVEQNAVVRALPMGRTDELARKIRHAVEDGTERIIYPAAYVATRHFPAITRWVLDRFTPPFKP